MSDSSGSLISYDFDAAVVGAGPAGTAAAITIARAGLSVALLERGEHAGAKSAQGGLLYGKALHELIPEFWKDPEAPLERPVVERRICCTTADSWVTASYRSLRFLEGAPNCATVLRARFDRWLASKAERAGVTLLPSTAVRDVVRSADGRICGVRTCEGRELKARVVVACDGANSMLAQKAGLRPELRASEVALGAKEVLALDSGKLEDRFCLEPGQGATIELFGSVTEGMLGGAFLYTNKETLSLGVVCKLSEYQRKGLRPTDHLERIKRHPAVRKLIDGAKTLECGANLVPVGGLRSMPPLAADGFLVAGDAAQMANPAYGEGGNLAMTAGRLAGETVVEAKMKGDFTLAALGVYGAKIKSSAIWPDLERVRDVPESVERSPGFLEFYPRLACELARLRFTVDGQPKRERPWKAFALLRERGLLRVARDLWPLRKAAL